MGFFDDVASERGVDETAEAGEFEDPTAPWVGGVVATEVVLAQSDEAAVVLSSVVAFPESFSFTVRSYLHRSVKSRRGYRGLGGALRWHDVDEETTDLPDDLLRLGLAWPDGGRATNVDHWRRGWPGPDETEPMHGLEEGGGGGSDREYESNFHAWPVPDAGDLTFVVEWPRYGISETTTTIDGDLIRAAASRARPVWSGDSDRPHRLSRTAMLHAFGRDDASTTPSSDG